MVFLLAANTTENEGKIGAKHFRTMLKGGIVVLATRAGIVNFDELLDCAASGHIRAGIDVWPEEPIPANHPGRKTRNTLLQAHTTGDLAKAIEHGILSALYRFYNKQIDLAATRHGLEP